jgi:hypothetical protein
MIKRVVTSKTALLIFVTVALVMCVTAALIVLLADRWSVENVFHRIEPGMTETEVTAVIARPPGDYRSSGTWVVGEQECWGPKLDLYHRIVGEHRTWYYDDGTIVVYFSDKGQAIVGKLLKVKSDKESIGDWLRRIGLW